MLNMVEAMSGLKQEVDVIRLVFKRSCWALVQRTDYSGSGGRGEGSVLYRFIHYCAVALATSVVFKYMG
jgi:hypothetical protein